MNSCPLSLVCWLGLAAALAAQSTISPTDKFAYSANLGTITPSVGPTTASDAVKFDAGPRRFFRVVAHKPLQP